LLIVYKTRQLRKITPCALTARGTKETCFLGKKWEGSLPAQEMGPAPQTSGEHSSGVPPAAFFVDIYE
jgi:hypothetical protein